MFQVTAYRILVGGPRSSEGERNLAQTVISNWNQRNSEDRKVILLPMTWEGGTLPIHGKRPQAAINEQIVVDCDAMIAFFKDTIGSSTGISISGTVEEIDEVHAGGHHVVIYCYDGPIEQSTAKSEMYLKLQDFKESIKSKSYYGSYADLSDLETKLSGHLDILVRILTSSHRSNPEDASITTESDSSGSTEPDHPDFDRLFEHSKNVDAEEESSWPIHFPPSSDWDDEETSGMLMNYLVAVASKNANAAVRRTKSLLESDDIPETMRQRLSVFLGWNYLTVGSVPLATSVVAPVLEKPASEKILNHAYHLNAQLIEHEHGADEACSYLREILGTAANLDIRSSILKHLSMFSRNSSKDWLAQLYGEQAFQVDPTSTETKFALAHKYSTMGLNSLAILHYTELIRLNGMDQNAHNNLAISLTEYDVKDIRIDHFRESSSLGNGLAFANLAGEYMDEGFFHDAERMISEARKLEHEPWTTQQEARLGSLKESRSERYQAITTRLQPTYRHVRNASEALLSGTDFGITATWINEKGVQIELTVGNDVLEAKWSENDRDFSMVGSKTGRLILVGSIKWVRQNDSYFDKSGTLVSDSIGYVSKAGDKICILIDKGSYPEWWEWTSVAEIS